MLNRIKKFLGGSNQELILAEASQSTDDQLPTDARSSSRFGFTLLIFGFGGFLLWASLAPLDEGVPSPGQVVQDSKRKTLQHFTGGVVQEVLVTEGQWVESGQVLIRLRDAQAKANYDAAQHSYFSLTAMRARLEAEQRNAALVTFPAELTNSSHPEAATHMSAQRELFNARKRALAGDLAVLEENRRAVSESAKGLDEQLALMKQELAGLRSLAAEHYVPRNQHFAAERQLVELTNSTQRTRSQAAELQLRVLQRQQEFRRDIETQLADITRESAVAAERLRSADEELKRTVVMAPESGQVVGLFSQMSGAVISPGQRLMDIVPKGEALTIEVRVAPNLIDQVHVGLTADINLHAFVDQMQLRIDGKVTSVAGDLLTEQGPTGVSAYYLARIQVTPDSMKTLGKHQLQPGMPVEVVIKTGERTMLNYVMRPLLRRLHSSLTES